MYLKNNNVIISLLKKTLLISQNRFKNLMIYSM